MRFFIYEGGAQIHELGICFEDIFRPPFNRNGKEVTPFRHPKFGLGWKGRNGVHSPYWILFFDDVDPLVQEMKAAEWVKQNKNKRKPKDRK